MPFATNFDRYLKNALNEKATKYKWKTGWYPPGQPWRVDVAGIPEKRGPKVMVEVELKEDSPVDNVIKIWRWASEEKYRERILFLHVFSGNYVQVRPHASPPTKEKQYDRAVFVGERMKKDRNLKIGYRPLRMKFKPKMVRGGGKNIKEGGGSMHKAAKGLALKIAKLLHSI